MNIMTFIIPGVLAAIVTVVLILRSMIVAGRPDEWTLCIRNGKLVQAGIGIIFIRLPWDRVVRFSSAIQRVSFASEVLTIEKIPVQVNGFILWSVITNGDGPFVAFNKLGIADRQEMAADDFERKHVLSKPQFKAFQNMLNATIERFAGRFELVDLLTDQNDFINSLSEELKRITEPIGVMIEGLQILNVRPSDPGMLKALSAGFEEETREFASLIRIETQERIKAKEIESDSNLEREKLNAERDKEMARAQTAMELQQQKARLMESEYEAHQEEMAYKHKMERLHNKYEHERNLSLEENKTAIQGMVLSREENNFKAQLDQKVRTAEVDGKAITIISKAEEDKVDAVRDYELSKYIATIMAEAFSKLPMDNVQWVTVGDNSPVQTLASLLTVGKEILMNTDSGCNPP